MPPSRDASLDVVRHGVEGIPPTAPAASRSRCPRPGSRLGHAQQAHFLHYAHVIDAISGERYSDLDMLIEATRADLVFRQCSASDAER